MHWTRAAIKANRDDSMTWKVISHMTIYRQPGWYAITPNVVRTPGGDLLALFQRAPYMGYSHHSHPLADIRSCRSHDEGLSWGEAVMVIADPCGGIMDFGTHVLADGSLFLHASSVELVASEPTGYAVEWKSQPGIPFWVRSRDDGHTWSDVKRFSPLPDAVWGVPAEHSGVCRSGLLALPNGRLLMPSKATDHPQGQPPFFGMLRVSDDLGESWHYGGRIAQDSAYHFSEPVIHRTPNGKILVLFRCHPPQGERRLALVTSDDNAQTWSPWRLTNIRGTNAHILALQDGRMFISVTTRWNGQQGCLFRVVEPEGSDLESVADITIRSDSAGPDCGYPWAVQRKDGSVLVVYWFTHADGTRGIEASVVEEI